MAIKRRDLSAYLVHLTRDDAHAGVTAPMNLVSILADRCIEARNPYGVAVRRLEKIGCGADEFMESQRVACFSETPLEDLSGLIDPGIWREYNFRPYGVVFSREFMLDVGANPLWYLNSYRAGGREWLVKKVNRMIDSAALDTSGDPDQRGWEASEIAQLTPFMEVIGEWDMGGFIKKKDFSFEREWRFRGDFDFELEHVEAIVTPPDLEGPLMDELLAAGVPESFLDGIRFRRLEEAEVLS